MPLKSFQLLPIAAGCSHGFRVPAEPGQLWAETTEQELLRDNFPAKKCVLVPH